MAQKIYVIRFANGRSEARSTFSQMRNIVLDVVTQDAKARRLPHQEVMDKRSDVKRTLTKLKIDHLDHIEFILADNKTIRVDSMVVL